MEIDAAVSKAGLPRVAMRVYEPREHNHATCIDYLCVVCTNRRRDVYDFAVLDKDIA
jgi:hypothetical protein